METQTYNFFLIIKVCFKMQKLTKAPGIGNYTSKEVRMRIVWHVWSDRFRYEKARACSHFKNVILLMLIIFWGR